MIALDYKEWVSPNSDKNSKIPLKAGQDRCLICERPMTEPATKNNQVRLLTDLRITLSDEELPDNLCQGYFEVGPDCYKKVVKLLNQKS